MQTRNESELFMDMVATPLWDMTDDLVDSEVITIYQNDQVDNALRTLSEANIMCAPVVDSMGRYVGMIDMMSLLSFSLGIFDQSFRPLRYSEDYLAKKRRFRSAVVATVMERRTSTKSFDVHEDYSLFHGLEIMCLSGEHRLAVVEDGKFVSGLINRSMICKWFLDNIDKMPQSLRETKAYNIQPFNLVSTIPVSRKAVDAFRILKNQQLSSVAVVDAKNKLVDVISSRDLRGIRPESLTFRFLWNTIDYYKNQIRQSNAEVPKSPICVTAESSLERVLREMVSNKVHQVFLVDNERSMRPIDVISMTDVLRFIMNTLKEPEI